MARVSSVGISSRSLLSLALALCALLAAAVPALAAPPTETSGVVQEGQTTTTIDVRAEMRSDKAVSFYYEYGTTTSYGATTSPADATLRSGSPGLYDASQTIGGLSPGGIYHVRVVATNADGTSYGPDSTIHTDDVDSDGDGVADRQDRCPTVHRGGSGSADGCPPPGIPTVQTGPVAVTSQGVKFTATVNSNGSGGAVVFQYSVFEDFNGYINDGGDARAGFALCHKKTGYRDLNGRAEFQSEFPVPPTHESVEVTCTPEAGSNSGDPKLELLTTSGFASAYDKVYVRAIARYSAEGRPREVAGSTQVFDPPGGGGGGGPCVVGPDSECGTGGGELAAALAQALAVSGKAARIAAILKAGGFVAPFAAPSAGQAAIAWFLVPKGARLAAAKPVVVAKGAKRISRAGKVKVKIRLSKKGRALLKRSKKVKLVARATFTPRSGAKVTKKRTITLKR
jgi:hypothetical protein